MGDRITIENGTILLETEEGQQFEHPESVLSEMLRQENTPPPGNSLLPDGVKFTEWRDPFFLVIHQYPAHLRSPPANPAQWGNHSIVHHQQCKFTEVTEVTGVDVQVRRLLDDISPPTLLSSCRCWTLSRRFHLTTQMEVCGNRGLRSVTLLTAMETNLSMYLLFLTPTMTQV